MKLFSNTRTKRSTAWMMLVVWTFALASGMANACLLEERGAHEHATAVDAPHGTAQSAVAAGHVSVADHDDDSHTSKAPCLKACDDGSLSLQKQMPGLDLIDPGIAFAVMLTWPIAVPVVSAQHRTDDLRVPISGPPIRVRYSRLAL
ncbi:MAG: hypothetical protein HYX43_14165 [Burkholderiales bacterium]|nr:hypothetical protein [Burkholderiales bacterium]